MKYSKYIKFWDFDIFGKNYLFQAVGCILSLVLFLIFPLIGWVGLIYAIGISISLLISLSLISYPFRYMKVKRLVRNGTCFSRESAGKILFCYVFNGNTEYLEHDWNGCICKRCGKDKHDWGNDSCVCSQCGEENHDWEAIGGPDYNYYYGKCKKCGEEK